MNKKKLDSALLEQIQKKKNSIPFGKGISGKGSVGKPQSAKGTAVQHRSINHGNH